jgi:hypothetical protein
LPPRLWHAWPTAWKRCGWNRTPCRR